MTQIFKVKDPSPEHPWVLRSFINSFYYLYYDAELFRELAGNPQLAETFGRTQMCRTAVVLYAFSLEALINRVMDKLLSGELKDFLMKREDKFSVQDKWYLLPLITGNNQSFDTSCYPWSHFVELIKLRNDYVHPKHNRSAYYQILSNKQQLEPLDYDKIPSESGICESDVVYRQLRIPRDPYAIMPEHIQQVKKVVDDTIAELDRLLAGQLTKSKLLEEDELTIIYPPGAQFATPTSLDTDE